MVGILAIVEVSERGIFFGRLLGRGTQPFDKKSIEPGARGGYPLLHPSVGGGMDAGQNQEHRPL